MSKKSKQDKPKAAVGLKYESNSESSQAPKVVAKGFGDLADDIIKLAKESGVLVHEDEALIETLARLDLGQDIPEELFYVIAELISFSYVLQGKFPKSWKNIHGRVDDLA
ncbi:flagellar biosynthesis protein FlhB [Alteromonadaceae bacterium M269]|nr:flagellar biosynthesis protein FlhB [Alteromonadaceae bacterium M269]